MEERIRNSLSTGWWNYPDDPTESETLIVLNEAQKQPGLQPSYPEDIAIGRIFLLGKVKYGTGPKNAKAEGWKQLPNSNSLLFKNTSGDLSANPFTIHMYALCSVVESNKAKRKRDETTVVKLCIVRPLSEKAKKKRKTMEIKYPTKRSKPNVSPPSSPELDPSLGSPSPTCSETSSISSPESSVDMSPPSSPVDLLNMTPPELGLEDCFQGLCSDLYCVLCYPLITDPLEIPEITSEENEDVEEFVVLSQVKLGDLF